MGKFEKRFCLILAIIMFGAAFYGMYYDYQHKGQDCAIEVQFKDSKATYLGQSV